MPQQDPRLAQPLGPGGPNDSPGVRVSSTAPRVIRAYQPAYSRASMIHGMIM